MIASVMSPLNLVNQYSLYMLTSEDYDSIANASISKNEGHFGINEIICDKWGFLFNMEKPI